MQYPKQQLAQLIKAELARRQKLRERYDWSKCARLNQLPPTKDFSYWLILAGRGFGKTRTGAETVRMWVDQGRYKNIALVGRSINEARTVMVEGVSGILGCYPCNLAPRFERSQNRLVWSNGAVAQLFGGDFYEKLRGPQFDLAWIDEIAKFREPQALWEQLMLGLRLGEDPKCIITTTPRAHTFLNYLMKLNGCVVTTGTTFDNKENLAKSYLEQIVQQFGGTRLAAQELYAQVLSQTEGALWNRDMIRYCAEHTDLQRVIVAVDPALTHHEGSDETGIVVVGRQADGRGVVLEDLSCKTSPHDWARRTVDAYYRHQADRVVAEINKGGDLVERLLRSIDSNVAYKPVRATRGKATRAEPIAALYEQGRILHKHPFTQLEEQLCTFVQGISQKSPDRLDALVWGMTELFLESESNTNLKIWG